MINRNSGTTSAVIHQSSSTSTRPYSCNSESPRRHTPCPGSASKVPLHQPDSSARQVSRAMPENNLLI
ncbi:hypothetical protein BDV35DRAFT_339276 [Aspergillus flavus]|uniref:Uncharacterized protein n=1 Tax=Aspergillus flavus TaxID=5059 RepID=A0A5N6HBW5_ASPFL|nr:hypothetical protein BDV35DRAFT_339276 [Aspergillus flavus]